MKTKVIATADSDPDEISKIGQYRKFLGVRTSAWYEMIIFFLVAIGFALALHSGDLFFSVNPHPFWIIVILLSAQYGTTEGLVAATLSTIILLMGNYPEQDLLQDQYTYFLYIAKNPILWFVAAALIGEIRGRHIRERDRLRLAALEAEKKEKAIASNYQNLKMAKERLEVKVAGKMQTTLMSYEALKKLESLDKDIILQGAVDLMRTFIAPEKCSVYLLEDNQLKNIAANGWQSDDPYLTSFSPNSKLFQEVIGGAKVVAVTNPEDRVTLAGEGIIAAPIKSSQKKTIYGMIKVEKLPFTQLRFDTIQLLRLIGEWVGTAYSSYLVHQQSNEARFLNEDNNLLTKSYLNYQKSFLTQIGKRLKINIGILYISLVSENPLSSMDRLITTEAFRKVVTENLRTIDQAFEYKKTDLEFAILLVNTKNAGYEIVKNKLGLALEKALNHKFSINYRIEPLYETE